LLILAILSLALWNTMLGYVLAFCSSDRADVRRSNDR
jgi:multicomponent Na+:H+ antiporter subunit G